MSKGAILALCMAILIPAASYLFLKVSSEDAVHVPKKYLLDTVYTRIDNGKEVTDSIWHVTKNIRLVNQLGDTVSLYDNPGKIIVADFFFTRCGSICPALTRNMSKMQQSFLKGGNVRKKLDSSIVHFLSFSIDPERDSVPVLKAYADKFNVNHDNWWMLTGPKDSIYNFAFDELKVDKFSNEPIDPNFVHTNRFVLIDRNRIVRGYYNGLDSAAMVKLAEDIGVLTLEKEKRGRRKLPFDPITLGIFMVLTLFITVVSIKLIFKNKTA
jgi:protein SCO1